jgi:hypothetical protein
MDTFRGGGGIRDILSPAYIVFIPWNNNKKYQKLTHSTELKLKTLKNSFLCGNFD